MKVWLLRAVTAAMRKDRATLLTTEGPRPDSFLPPLILVPGARPSQEQKCCALGKAEKSGPISAATVRAVVAPMVGTLVRSTPIIRCSA